MSRESKSHPEFEEISINSEKNPIFRSIRVRESKASKIIEDEVMERLEPTILDTISKEDQLLKRRVAAKIVDQEIDTPTVDRVLWYDESEPYFLCQGCFESNRNKVWKGEKRHPRFFEFQYNVHSQLQDECVCEYCREVQIQQVMSVIHSTIGVKIADDNNPE